ncbi:CDP-glycerol glycerophosphotransferase family protein [bacterium]|nr:CDP-glycerol glycerophosphotransferase family protein [bacterium]
MQSISNINRYDILKIFYKRIKNNKIVFSNYLGKSYGCNPKYITEEILKRNLPYKIVWLVNEPEKEKQNFPQSVKLVKYYSIDALKELLSAKV